MSTEHDTLDLDMHMISMIPVMEIEEVPATGTSPQNQPDNDDVDADIDNEVDPGGEDDEEHDPFSVTESEN